MRNRTLLWRPLVAKLFAEHGAAIAEAVKAAADKDLEACFALAKEQSAVKVGDTHTATKRTKCQLACLMAVPDAHQALIARAAAAAELQPSDVKPAPVGEKPDPARAVLPVLPGMRTGGSEHMSRWLYQNVHHPFPSEADKRKFAAAFNLSDAQVTKW